MKMLCNVALGCGHPVGRPTALTCRPVGRGFKPSGCNSFVASAEVIHQCIICVIPGLVPDWLFSVGFPQALWIKQLGVCHLLKIKRYDRLDRIKVRSSPRRMMALLNVREN